MRPANGNLSHWMQELGRTEPSRPSLSGEEQADIVIVGAGLTGLWAAYYLTELAPHLSVTVLEAEQVGFGASGRNGGWLSDLVPGNRATYAAATSHEATVRLQRSMTEGIDEVLAVCERENIDADQVRGGNLVLATTPAGLTRLRQRREGDLAFGMEPHESQTLSAAETAARVTAEGVLGGHLRPQVARIHAGKLVVGLAERVESRGVRILERSRVTELGAGRARTVAGSVRAQSVLACVEGYGGPLLGARRVAPINSSMIVTRPLSPQAWDTIGWRAMECVGDSAHAFMYAQRTADGRIAAGGRGSPYRYGSGTGARGSTDARTIRELTDRLRRYFPKADVTPEHAWSGVLGVTRDWCASVSHDPATGIGMAGGYAGHGVTATNVAARTLVDLTLGHDTELVRLPWVDYHSPSWEPEPLRWIGVHGMYRLFRAADAWEERQHSEKTSLIARFGGRLAGLE